MKKFSYLNKHKDANKNITNPENANTPFDAAAFRMEFENFASSFVLSTSTDSLNSR